MVINITPNVFQYYAIKNIPRHQITKRTDVLSKKSREVSKQRCCPDVCPISERHDHYKIQIRGSESKWTDGICTHGFACGSLILKNKAQMAFQTSGKSTLLLYENIN